MKTEMSKDGVIKIIAETSIECYALKKWCENEITILEDGKGGSQAIIQGSRLLIDYGEK